MNFPNVLIVSEENRLEKQLKKVLSKKNSEVFVKEVIGDPGQKLSQTFDYLIYIDCSGLSFERDFSEIKKFVSFSETKLIFVFPYSQKEKEFNETVAKINYLQFVFKSLVGVIFLGDVYDSKFNSNHNYFSDSIFIYTTYEFPHLPFAKEDLFHPISVNEVSEILVRALFSLKVYGKKTAILGKPIDAVELLGHLRKRFGGKKVRFSEKGLLSHQVNEKIFAKESKRLAIRNAVNYFLQQKLASRVSSKKKGAKLKRIKSLIFNRWRVKIVGLFLVFITLPVILLTISLGLLFIADKAFHRGSLPLTGRLLEYSNVFSHLSEKNSQIFTQIPYIQKLYSTVRSSAGILKKEVKIGQEFLSVIDRTNNFLPKLADDISYDLTKELKDLSLEFEDLYKELGFLESEINASGKFVQRVAKVVLSDQDLKPLRERLLLGSKIAVNLGPALGKENPKRYVVVLQNNKILRATGGRLEALLFVTLSNGKITDINVLATKELDQKLVGIVEPPLPLKSYFGKENWYLQEANWNPNFPDTAAQIEWFIDKELDEKVNGVIALNFEALSKVLGVLGEAREFEYIVDRIRDAEGYPHDGDDSVAVFLKSLADGEHNLDESEMFNVQKELIRAFDQKDAQVFTKDIDLRDLFSQIAWDGSFRQSSCSGNCYTDTLSLIESTVSGNGEKVQREYELEVFLEEGLVKRRLFVFMENRSSEPYTFFTRLMVPNESGFSPLEIITNESQEQKILEVAGVGSVKEAGVLEEIKASKTKALLFSWESATSVSYNEDGEYSLTVWKQPGVESFPLQIKVKLPENLIFESTNPFALTSEGELRYNTLLSRDFVSRIFWKK